MKIAFGKYKGLEISQIPTSYLKWLRNQNLDSIQLRIAISDEIDIRVFRAYQSAKQALRDRQSCAVSNKCDNLEYERPYHPMSMDDND